MTWAQGEGGFTSDAAVVQYDHEKGGDILVLAESRQVIQVGGYNPPPPPSLPPSNILREWILSIPPFPVCLSASKNTLKLILQGKRYRYKVGKVREGGGAESEFCELTHDYHSCSISPFLPECLMVLYG